MDEQSLTPSVSAAPVRHPLLRQLGRFAMAHFSLSLLSCGIGLFTLDSPILIFFFPLFLMALYYLLGLLFGASMEDRRQLALATLSQAAIAWCWAGLAIWVLLGNSENARLYVLLFTFVLACPSSLLVMLGGFLLGTLFSPSIATTLVLPAILAGLLPPLLFNLGSFWAARPKAQDEKGTAE